MKRSTSSTKRATLQQGVMLSILLMLGSAHLLNDLIQSMLVAIYPLLESNFRLSFTQIGLISLVYQVTASILQPGIGYFTDKNPKPYLLPFGMISTTTGVILLSFAEGYSQILIAAALMGVGSSIFHPEAARLTRLASGGKYGFAQSIFQVGGNLGSSFGPLLAGILVVRYGNQQNILFFALIGILAITLLFMISRWSSKQNIQKSNRQFSGETFPFGKRRTLYALGILAVLIFSKYFYMANLSNYYTFYLIQKFGLSQENAVMLLFIFLASVAIGTFIGGPVGDRIGRRRVIWFSMIGALPFTLILPHLPLMGVVATSIIIGLILSSAFSAIVVFAQELVPGSVGMIAGIFFGLMFGMSGIGALFLGWLADTTSLQTVFLFTSTLPILGLLTWCLPQIENQEFE